MPTQAFDVDYYCSQTQTSQHIKINSKLAKYSGMNFITKHFLEKLLTKILKNEFNTNFKVEIKEFDNSNLFTGKFQSLGAWGQNASRKGIYFSSMNANTVCGFNHVKYENNELYFLENMVVKYSARITQEDLKRTLDSNEYLSAIKKTKLKIQNNTIAEISDVDVSIKNNKINIKSEFLIPAVFGTIPQSFEFSSGLTVEDGRINFSNIDMNNPIFNLIIQNSTQLLNTLNPFTYKVQTKEKYDIILNVDNVKIENNEIFTNGTVVILKNYTK